MSFNTLNKEQLLYAAEFADLDVSNDNTKAEIIAALEEIGFTWNNYKKFIQQDEVAEKASEPTNVRFDQMVLLKMDRKNPTFDILGRRFTKLQPFQVMTADEAQEIIDAVEPIGGGFRIANPSEAKSFFG